MRKDENHSELLGRFTNGDQKDVNQHLSSGEKIKEFAELDGALRDRHVSTSPTVKAGALNLYPTPRLASNCALSPRMTATERPQLCSTEREVPYEHTIVVDEVDLPSAVSSASPSYTPVVEEPDALRSTPSTTVQCVYSPAGFHIPDDQLPNDSRCDQQSGLKHWSYGLYRGPDGGRVKVHYCKTRTDTERIARLFLDEEVLGFDIEWKPSAFAKEGIKKNVALIQIACETRIALFHVARFWGEDSVENLVAPTFKQLMESQQITKVGVSIRADCTRLRRFMGIDSRGLFELSHLHKLVKYSTNDVSSVDKRLVSLARQVNEHLGLPLWKDSAVRRSDWSEADLHYEQVQYAASDSYAGLQLYYTLEHKRKSLDPVPPRPYHAELDLPIRLASGQAISTNDDDEQSADPSPPPSSVEEIARDFLSLNLENKDPTPAPSKPPKRPITPQPTTAAYLTAQQWTTAYRASHPPQHLDRPTAPPTTLRAYALWYEQGLSVPETAAALRTPPLQHATVAGYVLEALSKEGLPFEKARLEETVVPYLSEAPKRRFAGWLRKLDVGGPSIPRRVISMDRR